MTPMRIHWTRHAVDRQKTWFASHGIGVADIERTVTGPEQTIAGEFGVTIAQSRLLGGLLRVPVVEVEEGRRIVTLYWTTPVERYWKD